MSCHISFGWGGIGHAAIAQIADNHISKSTKKQLKKCLAGTDIVEVSSDADENYYIWSRDIGFECSNPKILRRQPSDMDNYPTNIEPWCHSYSVDSLYNTYRHNREGDEYVRNAVMDLDVLITDLKANWAEMDKDECMVRMKAADTASPEEIEKIQQYHLFQHMCMRQRQSFLQNIRRRTGNYFICSSEMPDTVLPGRWITYLK